MQRQGRLRRSPRAGAAQRRRPDGSQIRAHGWRSTAGEAVPPALLPRQCRMPPSGRNCAQEAVASAAAELRSLRQQLRCVQNAESRRRCRDSRACTHRQAVLLRLMQQLGASWAPVVVVARRWGVCLAAAAVSEAAHIESLQAACSDPAVTAAAAAAAAGRPRGVLCHRAACLIAEAQTLEWLLTANARGVAPSAAALLVQMRAHWPAACRDARYLRYFFRLRHIATARKNWARRFRARWGVSWKRLPARADVPPDTVRQRVARGRQ
jgi:hypothetical protein